MTAPAPQISVIVVNYGTWALALEAVASVLARHHGGRVVDVHLVDNASPGDDALQLRQAIVQRGWSDRVTFYPETENHGFGRGNNLVLAALARRENPPGMVFLLNPDARLENEAIDVLATFLDSHPKVAVVGARVENPGGKPAVAAFRFPTLLGETLAALSFGPVSRLFPSSGVVLPPDLPVSRVDWVTGAAMMARLDVLARVGFFDPDFFLYFEEVELMQRIARLGHETWYMPEAHMVHSEGMATGVRSAEPIRQRRPDYWYRSWTLYFQKAHGRGYVLAALLLNTLAACVNYMISLLRGKTPAAPPHFIGDLWRVAGRSLLRPEARTRD